jgi:protein-S-isoprenylcysteine O-methyltransferase Ste14
MLTHGPYCRRRAPSVTVLIGVLLMWLIFSLLIVLREERALEELFGEAYRAYKARVPRWLGLPRA